MLWTWGKGLPYFLRTTFLSPVRSKRKYTASLSPLLFLLNHTNWKDKCHMRKGLVTLEALMLNTNLIVQYMFLLFLHSVLFIVFVSCSPCTLCFSTVRYCHYVFAFSDWNYSATNMYPWKCHTSVLIYLLQLQQILICYHKSVLSTS